MFECEVRFPIKNISRHRRRLLELGGKLVYKYEFDDFYYHPTSEIWDPIRKILRIRYWHTPKKPTTIYFVKNEVLKKGKIKFKRSLYPEGKLPLFSGELKLCRELLEDLSFREWLVLKKKKAEFWDITKHKFKTVFEFIPGLGWSGELEEKGVDVEKANKRLQAHLKLLGIDFKTVDFRPISVIFAEHKKRVKNIKKNRNYIIDRKKQNTIFSKGISPEEKLMVKKAVRKVVKEYGNVLRQLTAS